MKPVADSGQLALLSNRKEHLAQMFLDRVAATPNREAFRYPVGHRVEVGHLAARPTSWYAAAPPA